jgi:integrase
VFRNYKACSFLSSQDVIPTSELKILKNRLFWTCLTKNLVFATKTKIVAGEKQNKLPQATRGLLAKYAAYLEREGYYSETSYYDLISSLASDGADLLNPEDIKEKIAKHIFKGKDGKTRQWRKSTKMLACYAYDAFCKMEGLTWTKPKYKQEETELIITDEKLLDALIIYSRSRRMTAFLQCLKETYADPGEILALEWKEIKENIITIAHPCKGHLTGKYKVTARLISMLNSLPKTDKRVFPTTYRAMNNCLRVLKKKVARKMHKPSVLDITFKCYRHWGGTMIAHHTNGNVLTVKKMLRHKNVLNTMKYIHTINFADSDFEETVATTPEEVRKLGKEGWQKYDEMTVNGVVMYFYRKPKRFSGL